MNVHHNDEKFYIINIIMKNKVIQLIIIGFFLPIFLNSCNQNNQQTNQTKSEEEKIAEVVTIEEKWSDEKQQLYDTLKQEYIAFNQYLQPESDLLNLFEEQSKTSPTNIEFNPSNPDTNEIVNFTEQYQKFFDSISELEQEFPVEQQNVVENIATQLKQSSEDNISLASIESLLDDQQLTQTEICENIQLPLQIITQQNDPDCGIFGQQTYTELTNFLIQENQELEFKINQLDTIVTQLKNSEQESLNSNINQNKDKTNITQSKVKTDNSLPIVLLTITIIFSVLSLIASIFNYLAIKKLKTSNQQANENIDENNKTEIEQLKSQIDSYLEKIAIFESNTQKIQNTLENQSITIRELENKNQPKNINPSRINNLPPQKLSSNSEVSTNTHLAQIYQQNPNNLLQNGTKVGMTKQTTNKILGGVWDNIFLEENRRTGEYIIVNRNNSDNNKCYLFLDPHSMFNPQTLGTIHKSGLFVCHGNLAQSRKGGEITINKPATVNKTQQGWMLIEAGEISLP